MEERNESRYHIEQKNKIYILTTSLIGNKIKLVCQDENSQVFDGEFTMSDLTKLSRYFQPNHNVEQIQGYLNGIIEKQRVGISQNESAISIILYLINKDQISIPLIKKEANYNYNNYSGFNMNPSNQYIQTTSLNNIAAPTIQNQFNQNIHQGYNFYPNNSNQYLDLIQNTNQQQFQISKGINQNLIKSNQMASVPNGGAQIPQVDSSQANYYQYDQGKIGKLEVDTNTMRAEHEKLKNDMKRLLEEAKKLKEQNQVYKTDHDSLTNENAVLKTENDNYKKHMSGLQNENKGLIEENNSLKNQISLLNKDVEALDNQNNQIRKMYEDLENEYNIYKNQTEEINKENELLKGQIDELNNNFTLINNELENIKNENNIFKANLEQQQNNNNEDYINKLIDEINIYKQKAEENELLRKHIEELQYQLQIGQERREDDDLDQEQEQEQDQGKEVKGDIIHDIKELEMITKKINKDENKKIIINLLYKASVDSDRASAFHEKCDQAQNTIVLVETKNGKRFGGYTTCSWSGNCVDKNDSQAFIFSFDKMKTYDNIPGDEAIGCYPKFGPIFLGCQIKIFDNAFTKGGTTFEKELNFNTEEDYELTGGDRTFDIKDIEVYEVIIE